LLSNLENHVYSGIIVLSFLQLRNIVTMINIAIEKKIFTGFFITHFSCFPNPYQEKTYEF